MTYADKSYTKGGVMKKTVSMVLALHHFPNPISMGSGIGDEFLQCHK